MTLSLNYFKKVAYYRGLMLALLVMVSSGSYAQAPHSPLQNPSQNSQQAPSQALSQGMGKISVNFRDTPLRLALKVFTLESGLNFVFSPKVAELPVTAQLEQISWDRALQGILASSNLTLKALGPNLAQIYPADQSLPQGYNDNSQQVSMLPNSQRVGSDQSVFSVNLRHASAVYLQPRLEKVFGGKDVTIVADEKANGLLIRCPAYRQREVAQLINRLDRKPVQVEISSRIVEISTSQSKFTGVLLSNRLNFDPGRGLGFGSLNVPNSIFSNYTVDPGVSATAAAGNFNFKFASLNRVFDLDLLLKLEEKRGNSKILQSSTLLVTNNEPANIQSGFSDFFFGFSSNPAVLGDAADNPLGDGTTSLTEVRYNLSLAVTPEVTAGGEVLLNLSISSDIPQASQFPRAVAAKSRRKIETQMIRASGETAVIGGIYDKRLITNTTRIPILSDIPLIGPLFRSTSRNLAKVELVILVTPKIIYPKGPGAGPLTQMRQGGANGGAQAGQTGSQQPLPPIEALPVPERLLGDDDLNDRFDRAALSQDGQGFDGRPPIEARPEPEARNLSRASADGLPPIEANPVPEQPIESEVDLPEAQGLPPNGVENLNAVPLNSRAPALRRDSLPSQNSSAPSRSNGLPPIEAAPQPEAGLDGTLIGPPPIDGPPEG